MAAYAGLTSLMHIVKQVQEHCSHLIYFNEEQIESVGQKVSFLHDFLENHSNIDGEEESETIIIENRIADAAYKAEDVIESHVVSQIHAAIHSDLNSNSNSAVLCSLDEVIENLDHVKKRVVDSTKDDQRLIKIPKLEYSSSSRFSITGKVTVTGLDEESIRVMEWLTGPSAARQIISIVGMGGIGKTTLAKSVYEKPLIVQHFDIRIWVTVSQQYSRHKILLTMVLCLKGKESGADSAEMSRKDENQLGELLYKSLSGRRYLVVMDDTWDIEDWDLVRRFLPDNGNRSRVVVTTRQSKMATHFGPCCLKMDFLDIDKSWELFCEKTFGQESCPLELEEIGKRIVDKCKGLPLSIVVISGLLANSSMTRENWENASKNLNSSTLNSRDGEYCMKILSLSYNYLPAHLKPCFLYMSLFPEDHEIRVTNLVKLWVAEGFLKLNKSKSLEETAEGYLLDLMDRNLVLVGRRRLNGRVKTCEIHDLLRDLCLRIVHQRSFLCLLKMSGNKVSQDIGKERRLVFHDPKMHSVSYSSSLRNQAKLIQVLRSASQCRSLLCDFDKSVDLSSSQLMRALGTKSGMFNPKSVFKLVNLRYFSFMPNNWFDSFVECHSFPPSIPDSNIPSTISLLWNVQTMICRGLGKRFVLPSEFWRMSQLRHVEFDEVCLPNVQNDSVLTNLETLSNIVKFTCDNEMAEKIPNVKKLKITYYNISMFYKNNVFEKELYDSLAGSYHSLESLERLHKLESLNICFHGSPQEIDSLRDVTYPLSLQKLTLLGTRLKWEDLTSIGSLPNLRILVLKVDSVLGPRWDPVDGEFSSLRVLKIYNLDLENFNADETHFPALESIYLEYMLILDDIPSSIGYIPTLKSIELYVCSESSVISSKMIVDEQESNGNEDIQVRVTFRNSEEVEKIMMETELESLASDNFLVNVIY